MEHLHPDVLNEPKKALFGGIDGNKYYYRLFEILKSHLSINGIAIFEMNSTNKENIESIFSQQFQTNIVKDNNNMDRFIIISPQ
jgi:methylase of polypeptide subunit release factors